MNHRLGADERRRSPIRGAALATALLMTACGGSGAATTTPTTTVIPGTTVVATSTIPDTSTTSLVVDPTLEAAVNALGTRYRFVATITVDGSETTLVEGLVTDGTGHYLVTVGGERVEYLVDPTGQWARPAGGEWTVLSTPAPVGDPLAALTAPTTVTPVAGEGGDVVLEVTFPATVLGFTPGDDVTVTITIAGGILSETRYVAPAGAALVEVVTRFTPDPGATTVTVPAG